MEVTAELLDRIEDAAQEAEYWCPGPWELHTGCSWRRISRVATDQSGDVVLPTNCQNDGHPDLSAKPGVLEYIATLSPDVALAMVNYLRAYKRALEMASMTICGGNISQDYVGMWLEAACKEQSSK